MDSMATETCGLNDLHFVHNRRLVVGSVAHVVISYAVFQPTKWDESICERLHHKKNYLTPYITIFQLDYLLFLSNQSQGRNYGKILNCDLCDGGQNLPPLVGIGLRYLKFWCIRGRSSRALSTSDFTRSLTSVIMKQFMKTQADKNNNAPSKNILTKLYMYGHLKSQAQKTMSFFAN